MPCSRGWSRAAVDPGTRLRVERVPAIGRPTVRLRLHPNEVTMAQLGVIQRVVPALGSIALPVLRDRLRASDTVVVGDLAETSGLDALTSCGLVAELVDLDDYNSHVRRNLPPPREPAWSSARATLEVVVLPSFSDELVIRLWEVGDRGQLQLGSLGIQIWGRHFCRARWTFSTGEPVDLEFRPERLIDSLGELDDSPYELVRVSRTDEPLERRMLDGTRFEITARIGDETRSRSVLGDGEAADRRLIENVFARAARSLRDPEGLACLSPHLRA